ncbi:MAG: glycosyltransferase family 2 protein [Deltaproteobacteria bacterium]|nr:glycosyltransferase family 2 protein [Deltaproteobacteria bacterium]
MLYMISVVIPTFNRGYTLSQVLDSYYRQKFVEELIIVDDGGSDDTAAVVDEFSRKYLQIKTIYLKNEKRKGAPYSRRRGLLAAQGEFVLFGDDDDFLEDNYTEVCLNKLKSLSADIVSGRHFYRNPAESVAEAIARFGQGSINVPPFDFRLFHINMEAKFQGDAELPFTHAIFVVRRSFLLSHEIDTFYRWGNGFREESDVQAKIYINGGRIIMTNETHSVHMHSSEVISGGQRVGRYAYLFWSIFYTAYFFKKYYRPVMERQGKNESCVKGVAIYFVMVLYLFIAQPLSVWKRKILG